MLGCLLRFSSVTKTWFYVFCFQLSSNKCSARTMDEDVTRLAIHSEEPKIILHGSGNYHSYINSLP